MTEKKIVVTGGTGFLGSVLVRSLRQRGDDVVVIGRGASVGADATWDPAAGVLDASLLEGADVVVNLNGAGIGEKRWTDARKQVVLESRTVPTALLATTMASMDNPPPLFLSGSAMGYYGNTGDTPVDESAPQGDGFLASVCAEWEAAADPARDAGIRVIHPRTGIVLDRRSEALKPLIPLFKMGVGGPIGGGSQWWSWITLADTVAAFEHCIDAELAGPVNLVAPNPVTNREFAKALGAQLGRPSFFPAPKFAVDIRLGKELASTMAYGSLRVLPTVLEAEGFSFSAPTIEEALADVLA